MSDGDVVDAEWEETFFERCRRQRWAWANAALPQIGKAMWTDADVQWFMLAQMQRSLEDLSREQKDVLRFAVAYIGWLNLCELTEDALAKIAPLETEETIERCDTLTRQLCDQRQVANRALNDLRMAVKMLDGWRSLEGER